MMTLMYMRSARYLDGREIEPGARWSVPLQNPLSFHASVECKGVDPDVFVGTVRLGEEQLYESGPCPTLEQAEGSTRAWLIRRFAELLREE